MTRKLLLASATLALAAFVSPMDVRAEGADADKNAIERTADKAVRVTDDAGTTAVIKTKLLADQSTSGLEINVNTSNGIVSLEGDVDSAAERTAAERIAKGTNGVIEVRNQLKVQPD